MNTKNLERKYNFQWNENYRHNKYALIIACLFSALTMEAQTTDGTKTESQSLSDDQFPPIRAFQLQYEGFARRNFTSKLYHKKFQQGEIKNEGRMSVDANIPLYIKPRYIVTAALRYSSNDMKYTDVAVASAGNTGFQQSGHPNFQYFSATESLIYFSSLFHKPVIYNANLITDGNQNGFKRIYGAVTATLVVKKSDYTTISVGIIGFIDPAAVIPAVPSLAMQLRFEHSPWWIDCILPRHILFKRPLFRSARLSLGSELNGNIFYVSPSTVAPADIYQFNQFEVKTGATFEQKISKHFILSIRGGYQHILFAQLAPINKSISDDVYQTKPNGTAYYSIGLSYNIFKQKPKETQKL
ncbi:MAG: hypothetical protein MUP99_15320 [Pedobacter sp.]|nr:hypothetical protein [Pedobacter sp.]